MITDTSQCNAMPGSSYSTSISNTTVNLYIFCCFLPAGLSEVWAGRGSRCW